MTAAYFKYRAFISYSHADEKWARWLHRSLENYRVPRRLVGQKTQFGFVPARLAPVFRDRDELASATDLGSKLTDALEKSATLIVICSRAAATSHWVNEEILAYKRLGRSDRVFSLIIDGEPGSSGIPGEEGQECFPQALRYQIGDNGELTGTEAEPIAADAREGKDGKGHARIKLIAGIIGVGFNDLRRRELQKRNRRLAIISVSAMAGMLLAAGLATTAMIARNEAQEQRLRAETEAETARQTASFMISLFAVSDPGEARGRSITAREILTRGAQRISTELKGQPRIQTALMDTIGKVYTNLGLYEDAGDMLEDAVTMLRELPDTPAQEYGRSVYNLANVVTEQADYERAAHLYREALAVLEDSGDDTTGLHIDITAALAELYFRNGEYERAEPLLQQVLDIRLQRFGERDPAVADAIEELGLNLFDQGRLPEAETRLRESLALRWESLGREPHPDTAENINNLALVLITAGDSQEAEVLYRDALAMNQQLYGESHPAIALSLGNLADIYRSQAKLELAETTYREALAMQRDLLGDDHPEVARVMNNLALLLHDRGQLEEAMAMSTEALAMQRGILGYTHPNVAASLAVLGRWQTEAGDLQQAEAMLREALSLQLDLLEADHPDTAITRLDLADALLAAGNYPEALAQARQGEAALSKTLSDDHWITAIARQVHGAALHATGDLPAAEALIESSYRQLAASPDARPAYADKALERLIALYRDWEKPAMVTKYQNIQIQMRTLE